MKIENNSISPTGRSHSDGISPVDKGQARHGGSREVDGQQSKDRATLSNEAQLLAKTMVALSGTTDVRMERVEALRVQLMENKYQIPYQELARQLIGRLGLAQ